MLKNLLKDKLQDGRTVIGTWAVVSNATSVEIMGSAGFDFIIIDMEHGPHGLETAENMIRAAENTDCTPLLRVPCVDESAILRALDTGVHGIVIPQIQSLSQAQEAIKFALYPPIGERGHSPYTRAGGFKHENAATRMQDLNERTFIGLLIEGEEGIQSLPEIIEKCSDNIDLIYIGIFDLASALGHRGQTDHPEVEAKTRDIISMTQASGVNLGVLAKSDTDIKKFSEMGARFLAYQNDTGILYQACKHIVDARDSITS